MNVTRLLIFVMMTIAMSGCQNSRKFLQMNSNSPSPFLGLEFSVDAKERSVSNEHQLVSLRSPKSSESWLKQFQKSPPGIATEVQPEDSKRVSRHLPEQQKPSPEYSLPTIDLNDNSSEAAEVDAILDRFAGL